MDRLKTIRSRLYLAFGCAAAMTVVSSSFALYASSNVSATMTEIVAHSMPTTAESLRLAEEASTLVASAPRLMTAQSDEHRNEIARDIAAQSQTLSARIERLGQLDAIHGDNLEQARAAVVERLDALNQAVTERMKISAQRRTLALAVRKVHEDLLEAITPAIDDANFDLMTRNQTSGDDASLNQSIDSAPPSSRNPGGGQPAVGSSNRSLANQRSRESHADRGSDRGGGAGDRIRFEAIAGIRSAQKARRLLPQACIHSRQGWNYLAAHERA